MQKFDLPYKCLEIYDGVGNYAATATQLNWVSSKMIPMMLDFKMSDTLDCQAQIFYLS
jgi:hypothetical protein